MIPDLDRARRFVEARPPPGRLLLCGVTGSHFYGFPSPDSDLDLKGIHLAPTKRLLGLEPPPEAHDVLEVFEGLEHDLTTHELGRALALLLRGNGNVLERVLTPIQLVESAETSDLAALARASVSQRFAGHYRGYLKGMVREHGREPRVKSLLYAYRVALTGIHLFETGELRGDVRENAREHGVDAVDELVALKASGTEKGAMPAELDRAHAPLLSSIEARLDDAIARTRLPEEAPNREAIEGFLVELRLRELRG